MRLKNKKTGEIIDFEELNGYCLYDCGDKIILGKNPEEPVYGYTTLKEFNEDWEDYKPKESLIKDEKIRKAVRAWADANGVDRAILGQVNNDELVKKSPMTDFGCHISFEGSLGLERGRNYTIEELCGEEEE